MLEPRRRRLADAHGDGGGGDGAVAEVRVAELAEGVESGGGGVEDVGGGEGVEDACEHALLVDAELLEELPVAEDGDAPRGDAVLYCYFEEGDVLVSPVA